MTGDDNEALFCAPLNAGETHAGRMFTILTSDASAKSVEEESAYAEYKDAARKLADATSTMKAAQQRFSAALQKLTAIVAPIEETK